MSLPLTRYPRLDLLKIRGTDLFPAPERDWSRVRSICIGTKTRTIGDALILTSLPGQLKSCYPKLKVTTIARGYNPEVFDFNPHIDGISYLPGRVFGDDACMGAGHHIQVKEQFFGLPPSPDPKPEIYLRERERTWAKHRMAEAGEESRRHLPIILVHPTGHTWTRTAPMEFWEKLIAEHRTHFRFVQIGLAGQNVLAGLDAAFLLPKRRASVRRTLRSARIQRVL